MISPDIIRDIFLAISLAFVIGTLFRPFLGVIGYLIIMVTRPGLYYPVLGEIRFELVVGLLIIAVILFVPGKLERLRPRNDDVIKYMFMLFGVMLVSMVQAFDFAHSFEWMQEFAKVFLFFMMIVALAETLDDVKLFLWVFALLMTFLAYEAIYNFHSGIVVQSISEDRIDYATAGQGMGAGHVALANMLLQGMAFLWYLSRQSQNRIVRGIGLVLCGLSLYGIMVSGSRGGFVGLIALYLCVLYLSERKGPIVVAGAVGLFLLLFLSTESYFRYMETILDLVIGSADVSGGSRMTGLRHGFEMLIRRPILGVGPGCYPLARKAWFGWSLWAHNHYGELMGDLGIIGTVVWFKFLIAYLRRTLTHAKLPGGLELVPAIMTAILVATIVRLVVGMGSHSVYIFFWYMLAAIVIVVVRIDRSVTKEATDSPDNALESSRASET